MNRINNVFNKNEIENKIKDFKEGQDYSVSPTDEPNIKTYNFHDDKLRSMFRSDRVPVRVTREAYDGKDYTYRGHFEEGKDYNYSAQQWHYGENYQGNRGTDVFGDGEFKNFMDKWKWDEHYRENTPNKWTVGWVYRGKGNLNKNPEPKRIEPNFGDFFGNDIGWSDEQRIKDLQEKISEWKQKLDYLESQQPRNEEMIEGFRKDIKDAENAIRTLESRKNGDVSGQPDWVECPPCGKTFNKNTDCWGVKHIQDGSGFAPTCCSDCAKKYADKVGGKWGRRNEFYGNDYSDLRKENQELRQQLTEVQKQLSEVLEELKKLKNNSVGQNNEKLTQQIVQNERLIKDSENISVSEVQEQVNKSQALMNEINTNVSQPKDNKGGGSLPYVIGGSVILASAGIIGYLLLKKNKSKKVA